MTTPLERYSDLVDERADPAMAHLVTELDRAYQAPAPPPELSAAFQHLLDRREGSAHPFGWRMARSIVRRRVHRRRVSLVASVALALSLAVGYVQLSRSAPASAQTILHQAEVAALQLPPHRAIHLIYQLSHVLAGSQRVSGTIDLWIQTDAHGTPALVAQTETMRNAAGGVASIDRRVLHNDSGLAYSSQAHTITRVAARPQGATLLIGGAAYFDAFAQGPQQTARLLPRRRFKGVTVDAIRVESLYAPSYTVYFDVARHVLRGMDSAGGQAWLTDDVTMPASAAPPHTFSLNAPVTARPALALTTTGSAADLPAVDYPALALVSICNVAPSALATAITAGAKSPLALCQEFDPGMTRAALVAAETSEQKARFGLDEGVAAGKLSAAQEASELANLQVKLTAWVNRPLTD